MIANLAGEEGRCRICAMCRANQPTFGLVGQCPWEPPGRDANYRPRPGRGQRVTPDGFLIEVPSVSQRRQFGILAVHAPRPLREADVSDIAELEVSGHQSWPDCSGPLMLPPDQGPWSEGRQKPSSDPGPAGNRVTLISWW